MKVFNTLTRTKEEFMPLTPGEVGMYSCGVTVYDHSHIGHARSMIVFDVICRYLAFKGYHVTFVRNFTDVEDKIIRRAQQEGVSASEVSERYIAEFRADMQSLGVLPPPPGITYHDPKATEFVPEMVALIERLVAGGFAYVIDGDVYFEIRRFPRYGRLSGKNLDDLLAGARVDVDERKRDPRDFALWKSAKPGEPAWPSPWGLGRPGWHIECSVMAVKYLGETFDIHGGGEDLIFPHHECEIAQSEAATDKPFARFWLHNGMLNLGAEKMSKSLGNTLVIREVVRRHAPDAVRLWLLGTLYRHPIDFAEDRLRESATALRTLWGPVEQARRSGDAAAAHVSSVELVPEFAAFRERFIEAMDDDFNTPQALGVLYEFGRELNRGTGHGAAAVARGARELASLIGLLGINEPKRAEIAAEARERIDALVRLRMDARSRRDWKRADEIRAEVDALGAVLEDSPSGTTWRPKT